MTFAILPTKWNCYASKNNNTRLYPADAVWYRHPSGQPTWHDVTGRDMTWHDVTRRDTTWHDMIWRDMMCQDATGRDLTWHDVTWPGVAWRCMAWREMTWLDVTWREMMWHDMTWCAMTWHDMTWRDMTRHDVTWRDMTWHDNEVDNKALVVWPSRVFRAIAYKFRAFLSKNEYLGNFKNLLNRKVTLIFEVAQHGRSGMSAKDSLTSKTKIVKKYQKSTRHNHQYLQVRLKPEVYLDFRGHPNMVALWKYQQWIPWPQNMNSQEISKIYKTHSPVPPNTSWTGSLPGFSRLPKHGSSVEISAMDSLTSKTRIVWKFQNHQYFSNRKLTWIIEVTQTS